MVLIQLLLPRFDNDGKAFPNEHFRQVRQQLLDRFSGLTCYSRTPAEGYWENDSSGTDRDEIIIFEVMSQQLDRQWWQNYRQECERLFRQEEIVIRSQTIEQL